LEKTGNPSQFCLSGSVCHLKIGFFAVHNLMYLSNKAEIIKGYKNF